MKKMLILLLTCCISFASNAQDITDIRVFNAMYYLEKHADLKRAFNTDAAQAKQHWLTYGINEGRQASPEFHAPAYLNRYPDLVAAFGKTNYRKAIEHYLTYGINEGRDGQPKIGDAEMCWTESRGRGAGTIPNACGDGEQMDAGLCYPKCRAGYTGVGPVCWANCPSGFRNDGAYCAKPASYGRGGGYTTRSRCEKKNAQGCEKNGLLFYPKCRENFHNVGCCVCSPDCPAGFTDIGVSCQKPSYGRGVGKIPKKCSGGKENQDGLCYNPCPSGFKGIGPVCWANECPSIYPVRCVAGCARTSGDCKGALTDQVFTSLRLAVNVLGVAGMAIGESAELGVEAGEAGASKSTIKDNIKNKAAAMGEVIDEKMVENAVDIFYDAQQTGKFNWKKAMEMDPTGIVNVVKAFDKPLCSSFR